MRNARTGSMVASRRAGMMPAMAAARISALSAAPHPPGHTATYRAWGYPWPPALYRRSLYHTCRPVA